ncbi:ABC transporter ATP-binding protein [Abyssalbus ytuae]|uniref:ABC transporter ATP-binding protein n=1 Tax=Abyssalbus ytuae TaxID=2926907 RepID=A0A9E7A0H6_9FLAO|nr:ABC transporter ATP-binding protein [Abyssalbus ytuae]UOB18637.1 ABC transporter ATP-binding protein [Abyssalbus ytuae]
MITTINLTKKYNGNTVLNNLNLNIEKGEIFCLLGQNGAGKTTTINLLMGFIKATSGEAQINGYTISPGNTKARKYLAYIPEVVQLYGNLTGIENLDFFSKIAGFKYSKKELVSLLDKVGLQQNAHLNKLSSYSKGMRQKVGIAIALAKNADIIFMDEPISGLDPKATVEFTAICKELAKEGKSIFMATHDIFNAVKVGTKIGIMKEGCLVYTTYTNKINANELQDLYLKTI